MSTRLGLKRFPRSWRGHCPACEYASTFTVKLGRDGRLLLFCPSCENYDAAGEVRALGARRGHPSTFRSDPKEGQDNIDQALARWARSTPLHNTPAEIYFERLGLGTLSASPVLRYCPDTAHPKGERYPSLIALIQDVDGIPIGVEQTYLTRNGQWANVYPRRACLGAFWGGAIRLQAVEADKPLVIGEGLETSASAGRMIGLPAWAALNAGNLSRGLVLPDEAHLILIAAGPPDPERVPFPAEAAWRRWTAEGRAVRIVVHDGWHLEECS